MHIDIVKPYLEQLAARSSNNPLGYLWEFAPVHDWWHSQPTNTRPIGFLTFHRIVIDTFGSTFPSGQIPVQPSPLAAFPGFLNNANQIVSDVGTLQQYSAALEGWHNQVHQAVGGTFLDAARNIYLRIFWEFHVFLNERFGDALQALNWDFDEYLQQVTDQQQRGI